MRPIVFVFTFLAILTGCSGSQMDRLSDEVLAQKYGECLDRQPTSPGGVQACENLRRECDRRRTDLGKYICRTY